MACVLVDIDGTLLHGPSIERCSSPIYGVSACWAHDRSSPGSFFLHFGLRYGWLAPVKNKAYLAGLEVSEIARMADIFVRERVLSCVRRSVLQRLQTHLAAGEPVMLLSGTPDFLVHPLADSLGAHAVAATVCAQNEGVFSANPPVRHPFYQDKVGAATERCPQLGFGLTECTAGLR
jgi:hypothetical protein